MREVDSAPHLGRGTGPAPRSTEMSSSLRVNALALLAVPASTAAQSPSYVFVGKAPNAQYGALVANAGDTDGDGHPDLLIGAPSDPRTTERAGALELRSGRTRALLFTWLGPGKGDQLGSSADGAGDIDGDGRCDVLCGVLGGVGPEQCFIGHARVYSGASGARLFTFAGREHYDFFGLTTSGLGDLDGDGRCEFAIGCPGDDSLGRNRGFVEVRTGSTGAVLHTLRGDADDDQFGWSCRVIGDADGDGTPDLCVAAPGHKVEGRSGHVRLHSGRNGVLLHRIDGESAGDRFGWSIASAGDLDGDGIPDILCGAPGVDGAGEDSGAAYVHSGRTGERLLRVLGEQAGASFGWAVSGAGDIDGDRRPDLWIASPREDSSGDDVDRGAVRLVSGTDGRVLLTLRGRNPKAEFGSSICDLGEVEAGRHELVVGARSDLGPDGTAGTASVFRVALAQGDMPPSLVPGADEIERIDPSRLASIDPPRTIELGDSGNRMLVYVAGITVLALLGATFVAARR